MKEIEKLFKYTAFGVVAGGLSLFALTSCSDDDDDDVTPGQEYTAALKELYPGATNVKWERKSPYMVAEFRNTSRREVEVWFDNSTKWAQTTTDYERDEAELPLSVLESISMSDFSQWLIDDIDYVERPAGNYYVVEFEQQGSRDTDLVFDESGNILLTWPGGLGDITPLTPLTR